MTTEGKLNIIKSLFRDYQINPQDALPVLAGKAGYVGKIHKNEFLIKALNFLPRHTIRAIFRENMLVQILSDEVINGLFSSILRERYTYVRKLL